MWDRSFISLPRNLRLDHHSTPGGIFSALLPTISDHLSPDHISCMEGGVSSAVAACCALTRNYHMRLLNLSFAKNVVGRPYEQISIGIEPENISCRDGLELHFKINSTPICIKESTFEKLKEWRYL